MVKQRAVIVHQDGSVNVATGPVMGSGNQYDLDAAIQKGAKILQRYAIGSDGTSTLLIIKERWSLGADAENCV
jgi:hypothetical protein